MHFYFITFDLDVPDYSRWNPYRNAIFWDATCYDSAGPNDAVIANIYSFGNHSIRSDKATITDTNRTIFVFSLASA